MAEEYDAVAELHRLRIEAARTRLQAIQSQLSLASTFCVPAKTEVGAEGDWAYAATRRS
jgi:hypothetical protein